MASHLPTALKSADISRFALRAAQLEKYKPIVSYWLEYYVLQQILTKSLHNDSPEVSAYAAQLMDKLESTKQQYSEEAAVTDDIAAQAYMEQFASETLARAEKAQTDDTVTKQTADTLQAAATFLEAISIWGEPNAEIKTKIKFAKYHALRIVKALKNGQDPNTSNPKPQAPTTADDPAEAEIEDELRQLEKGSKSNVQQLQPTVEDVHDAEYVSPVNTSLPVHEAASSAAGRDSSIDGGYFPSTSPIAAQSVASIVPEIPAQDTFIQVHPSAATPAEADQALAEGFARQDDQVQTTDKTFASPPQPTQADALHFYNTGSAAPRVQQTPVVAPPPAEEPKGLVIQSTGLKTDDDAVMAAQKHAKWAISALNFEDVPTAVRELRKALESLGGL